MILVQNRPKFTSQNLLCSALVVVVVVVLLLLGLIASFSEGNAIVRYGVYSCGVTSGVSLTGTETNYRQRHTDICVASITGEDQRTASTTIARYSLCGSSSSTSRGMHSYVLIHQVTPIITVDVRNRDSSEHRYWLSLIVANSIDFCNLKHVAVYSLPDQTSRREALCFLPVRSSVRSFVRFKT